MVYLASVLVLVVWAFGLVWAQSPARWRVRVFGPRFWRFWSVKAEKRPAEPYCPKPHYHETMQILGHECSACIGGPTERPAFWRVQVGPLVVVRFDEPWSE